MNDRTLEVRNLNVTIRTDRREVRPVNDVSLDVPAGSIVGIVGESGCGKSVTSMSVMRLLQGPQGQIYSGSIRFNSYDFKRDEFGNPIPRFKRKPNGKILFETVKDKDGHDVIGKDGKPVKAPVQLTDESGVLMYEMEERYSILQRCP